MEKGVLIFALTVALAVPMALAQVSTSSSKERTADSKRLEEAGKKVEEKVNAGASQEEIAAAAAEVQKIYAEIRAKDEAEKARLQKLGESDK